MPITIYNRISKEDYIEFFLWGLFKLNRAGIVAMSLIYMFFLVIIQGTLNYLGMNRLLSFLLSFLTILLLVYYHIFRKSILMITEEFLENLSQNLYFYDNYFVSNKGTEQFAYTNIINVFETKKLFVFQIEVNGYIFIPNRYFNTLERESVKTLIKEARPVKARN